MDSDREQPRDRERPTELFSVYYQSCEALGSVIERECHLVPIKEALRWYRHHTSNACAMAGMTARVFVCDGGDCIVAEWKDGKVVWPKEDV